MQPIRTATNMFNSAFRQRKAVNHISRCYLNRRASVVDILKEKPSEDAQISVKVGLVCTPQPKLFHFLCSQKVNLLSRLTLEMAGADPGGMGTLPVGRPPNFIKREKTPRACIRKPRVLP